jgi:hypothetical protein
VLVGALVLLVVLLVVVVVAVVVWRSGDDTRLEAAVDLAPAGAERLSWTDWAGVRREVGADLGDSPRTDDVVAFLDAGFERDLTNSSALVESAPSLHEEFGFSPASIDWELFSQSPDGAVDIIGVDDDTDLGALADRLGELGYQGPEESDGVWRGGGDLLARIGPQLTPELQYFAVLEDQGLVLTSDRAGYLAEAVEAATGDADTVSGLDDVVAGAGEALAASVYSGGYACEALAMAGADDDDQAEGEALVERAGEVNPMTAFAMAARPGGDVRVAMSFESDEQARTNADTRAALAGGPAPGQGGDFTDRFRVRSATAEGSTVLLDLDTVDGQYVLSDLTSGPVLFATC